MNEGLSFPFLTGGRLRNLKASELEAFLELLPHAAALVDSKSWIILLANPKAAELTFYTRNELTGMSMATLIAGWDEKLHLNLDRDSASSEKGSALNNRFSKELILGNHTHLPVQLFFYSISFRRKTFHCRHPIHRII